MIVAVVAKLCPETRSFHRRPFGLYDHLGGERANMNILLEICIDSVEGALAAERGGADRLELCAALSEGGITPSIGLVQSVVKHTKLPVMMMIRPRGGSFVYSEYEIETMQRDLDLARKIGVHGVVFGPLTESMEVDVATCKKLLAATGDLEVTFHRAFDEPGVCPLPSLRELEALGFHRLLTSGQKSSVADGTSLIAQLVEESQRVKVMPGAGVRPENAKAIMNQTGAREIHGTASRFCEYRQQRVTCEETVRAIREQLNGLAAE